MKTVNTTWDVRTYDVWGNREDGYDVNNVFSSARDLPIRLKIVVNNAGLPGEFVSASPSDYQLKRVFGVGCAIDTDDDDLSISVRRASDGYPIGELLCTSHDSLSPIRAKRGEPMKPYTLTCSKCGRVFSGVELVCHHLHPCTTCVWKSAPPTWTSAST